jgi:type I restriction enzyme, S subunit
MANWRQLRFASLLKEPVRNGIYKPKEFHGSGCKIVNMGELFAYPRLRAVSMKRVELSSSEKTRFLLSEGDLIFARRSLTAEGAGKCSIVMDLDDATTFESSIIRARPDPEKASSLFLYYLFNSPLGFYKLDTIRRQVAVAGITGSDLSELEIPVPRIAEQRSIASVLGALDDKIELNRRMNETLEATARAIFKDWFVDFRPTRTKIEGRAPYLAPETWELFPNQFNGEGTPNGWTIGKLDDLAFVIMGASPDGKTYNDQGLGLPLVNGPVEYGEFFLRRIKWTTAPNKTSRRGDLVLCVRGSTTGRHAFADGEYCLGRGVCSIRSIDNQQDFINESMLVDLERLLQRTTGSVFPNLSSDNIRSFEILIPDRVAREAYCDTVRGLSSQIWANVAQSETLAAIRDLLLPKLMTGEIRVKDAETIVEAVA